jgi:hypothetical protein
LDRISVRLISPTEPVPEWWGDEFTRRQSRLKLRIVRLMANLSAPISAAGMRQLVSQWSTQEVTHALELFVESGLLEAEDRTELYAKHNPFNKRFVSRRYYSLAGKHNKGD